MKNPNSQALKRASNVKKQAAKHAANIAALSKLIGKFLPPEEKLVETVEAVKHEPLEAVQSEPTLTNEEWFEKHQTTPFKKEKLWLSSLYDVPAAIHPDDSIRYLPNDVSPLKGWTVVRTLKHLNPVSNSEKGSEDGFRNATNGGYSRDYKFEYLETWYTKKVKDGDFPVRLWDKKDPRQQRYEEVVNAAKETQFLSSLAKQGFKPSAVLEVLKRCGVKQHSQWSSEVDYDALKKEAEVMSTEGVDQFLKYTGQESLDPDQMKYWCSYASISKYPNLKVVKNWEEIPSGWGEVVSYSLPWPDDGHLFGEPKTEFLRLLRQS